MSVQNINQNNSVSIEKFNQSDFIQGTNEGVPFTQISNYVIQNIKNREAAFLWVYMSSLPKNWSINKHHLAKHFEVSVRTIERSLSYLKDCNLIKQEQVRNEDGTLGVTIIHNLNGSLYKIYEENQPCDREDTTVRQFCRTDTNPHKSRPSTVRQKTVHGDLSHIQINKENKNKIKTKTENENPVVVSLDKKIEELADLQIELHGSHGLSREELINVIKTHVIYQLTKRDKTELHVINGVKKLINTQKQGFIPPKKTENITNNKQQTTQDYAKQQQIVQQQNKILEQNKKNPDNIRKADSSFGLMRECLRRAV